MRGTGAFPVLVRIRLPFELGISGRSFNFLYVRIDAHSNILMSCIMWCLLFPDVSSRCSFNVNSQFSPCSQGCVLSYCSFESSVRGHNCRYFCLLMPVPSTLVIILVGNFATSLAAQLVHSFLLSSISFEHHRSQDIQVYECVFHGSCNWFHFYLLTSNLSSFSSYSWSFGCLQSIASGVLQHSDVLGRPRLLYDFGDRRGFSV